MRISLILLSTLLLFFSACGGGGGGGGGVSSGTGDNRSTTPEPIPTPTFSCTSRLGSESGDKSLSCNNNTHVAYSSRENSLCRVDDLDGIAVSTCMETGQTLSAQTCGLGDLSVNCPDVDFSCSVSSLSTSDNWILSCDDNTAVSMDISNNELCRIDLTDRTGFCLDNENVLNKLPAVWTGYAQNFVGIGESVALNTPMWVPSGANFNYSATPANVCSIEAETGSLSIDGYGDCDIALTVSIGESSKVIQKRVYGRLVQNTVWNGYAANSMDFGTTPPALNSPQYAPAGAGYSYASENTDICTVNSSTGEIAAPMNSGDCVITMTSSATNYSDKDISFTLRVDPLDLPPLRWTTPYGSGPFDILTTVSAPSAGALTGQGNLNVTLENYRSTTPTICSVDETTGVPTLFLNGDCIIEAEPSVPGYTAETPLSTTLTVALAAMSLAWTSPISSLGNADSVQPNQPTGVPGATVLLGSLYSSRTPDTCRVNAISGEITGIANGLCTARLTVNFPGYQEGVVDLDITINDPQLTRWSGYSPRDVRFGETPVLADPTDLPNGVVCVYSSLAEDVCTVDDTSGELTLVDAGVCRIRMISSVSDHGDKLFEVDLNVMPLTFPVLGWGTLYGNGPFHVGSTGLAPTPANLEHVPENASVILSNFESLTTDICETDENGNLTLLRDGTCDLRAMVSAAGYTDVIVSGSLEVALAQMNLSWDGYDDSDDTISYGDAAPALESPSLTTATPHRFSYTSGDTTVCTVDEEGALTIIRDGECVITLTASALGYNEATVTSTLTINPATMRGIMWETVYASTPSLGVGSSMITLPPLGVPEGASVVYRTESAACTVDQISGTITGQSEGDCSVTMTVSLLGYEDFTETQTVPIGRGQEDVAWSGYSARTMVFGEAPPTLIPPTGIGGGGGASYGAFTFDTCRINFRTGLLRILNHGLCRAALFVYQEGYGVKTFFFDLTITPGVMGDFSWAGYDSNSVEFPNVPALEEPTGAPNGATLTYTSQTEEICTVDRTSGALTAVDAGVCTVEVTAEVTGYTSMSISSSITITPAAVSFAWTGYSAGSAVFGTVPPTLNGPTGAPAGTGFRYSSTPLTVCLVDGETGALTLSGVGTCTVTAVGSLLGYTDGSETFDLTVTPGMMSSLRWSGYLASSIDFGDTAPSIVRPEGVPQGTSFRYTSSTPDICTVDSGSGVLNILNAGDCMIGLTALATNYGDATVNVTLAVNSLEMDSLTWSGYSSSSIDYDDGAPTHNPPRGLPPGAILNYTTTTDACTVNSLTGVLTIVDAGTCTVSLTVSAIGYSNTTIDRNVMVNGRVINVTWTGYSSSSIVFGESLTLDSPTANPSNVTLSYASDTTDICTVDGVTGAVTMVDNGTCTITLTASAIGYNDATESHSITVNSRAMSGVAWSGYAASSILIKGPFVYPNPVEGAPYRAGYRYSTSTPNVCAVEKDGDLWGRDLGTCRVGVTVRAPGYKDQTFPEVDVTVVRGGIAVGEYQSCALLSDGQVKCWGSNTTGSLGQGHRDNLGDDINEMGTHLMSVDLGTGLKAKYLAVIKGEFYRLGHSCAIVDDGRVKCWGSNHSGQLGQGHNRDIGDNSGEMGDNLAYTNLGDERTKILSLGGSFSCAVLNNNKVKCWGGNIRGELGQDHSNSKGQNSGDMGDNLLYTNLGSQRWAKDISSGSHHVCVLLDNNNVKCWGANNYGQLGQGHIENIGDSVNEMNNLNPINLGDNRTAKKIVAGESHSCAILDNNNLVCWGENGANELGVESDQDNIKIGDAAGEMGNNLLATHLVSQNAIYMDLDIGFTCVISADGTLYCWGTNDYGQLGLGHTDTKGGALTQAADIRVDLGSNRRAKTVQAGSKHSCALLDNDEIKCWGRNNYGQLGLGNTENRGDDANEMGDHLAAVDLVPNMIDLAWTGYAFDTITYGDNAPAPNVPTGAPTGATIAYSTTPSGVCRVESTTGVLTIEGSGTCTVSLTARVDGYIDGRIDRSVTVRPGTIGLNWLGYSSDSIGFGDAITLSEPTVDPQKATLAYTSSTQGVCTVDQSSGELTIRAAGICRVRLTASVANYTNATVDRTVTVNPGTMSLNWPGYSPNSISFGDATTLNSPTVTPNNATLRYNSSTHSVCTVNQSSGELTIRGTGICSISLTASATHYTSIVLNRTVTVGPGTIDLTWTGYSAGRVDQGGRVTLSNPTVTPSTATLNYTASPSSVCTVNSSSGALTIVGVGTCRVRLTASATNYANRTVERVVIVGQDTIGLSWTGYSSNSVNFGDTLTLNQPTADPSDATLRYTSSSLRICTVNSSTGAISQVDSGTCSITLTATRAGYRSESMSKSIYIARISMSSFDWDGYSNNNVGTLSSVPTLVAPTGVPTGATFEYYSSSPNVCSVNSSSGALSLVATGSCNIQVTVRAKGYNAKIDRVTVTIN